MENYYFFYKQNNEKKVMQMRLPIGTQAEVEHWQPIFNGFNAELVRVSTWTQLCEVRL